MSKKRTIPPARPADGRARTATPRDRNRPTDRRGETPGADRAQAAGKTASVIREVIESIVIAVVLACLFRAFEAEAFVIPTGSMAPTLMGRHKDLVCDECHMPYRVSASSEIDSDTNRRNGKSVIAGTCPNCRHTMYVGPESRGTSHPSYNGDRILVAKFPYHLSEPQRWDVAVFKFPGKARTNFIKRIVGLPGETVRISHGDLFVKNGDHDGWRIARKPADKRRAMMQMVYDNDYVPPQIVSGILPSRWTSDPAGGWNASSDMKAFHSDGSAGGETWLGYQHRVPCFGDWKKIERDPNTPISLPPQLIKDFTAYDTDETRVQYDPDDVPAPSLERLGRYWVGDLAVGCELVVSGQSGEALFELVEGGRVFQCRIDVSTGKATLAIDGLDDFRPSAMTQVRFPGTYRILFANFDDELSLDVNGREVQFDAPATFGPLGNDRQTEADKEQPVRIGSAGASLEVRHLKVYRDIYYIADRRGELAASEPPTVDFDNHNGRPPHWSLSGSRLHAQDRVGPVRGNQAGAGEPDRATVAFSLEADQFLVFGDNSAESMDSRLWEAENIEYFVRRDLLIGKALLVYWPHSLDRIPGTNIPVRFFPNFKRMRFVR